MKFISNVSNGLFWLIVTIGIVFFFTIPISQKTLKFKTVSKQIFSELKYPFTLPSLKFAYNGLESYMDEQTLRIHHTKHHQAYVDNLNKAMEKFPEYQSYSLEDLLANLSALPEDLRSAVKSHGGGHFNHTLFWTLLCKQASNNVPSDIILEKIKETFESFDGFKQEITKQALSIVGSGWVWLCVNHKGDFKVIGTYNHETPYKQNLHPILVLDVWEHAYYLKYQNRRVDFVASWWNLIDWKEVERLYIKYIQN